MSATPRGGGGGAGKASAWAVNWRNPQARKNKSWENDGYVHAQGPNVTLYGEDGHKMGQKNVMRPLAEEMEIVIAGKEVRIDYGITISEFWSHIKGEGSSRGTPAAAIARPGFFTRDSQTHSTPQAQGSRAPQHRAFTPQSGPARASSVKPSYLDSASRARPAASSKNRVDDVFRADTPERDDDLADQQAAPASASKTWIDPKRHLQKPFKFPTPVRRSSPGLEYGPSSTKAEKTDADGRRRSKMREEVHQRSEEEHEGESDRDEDDTRNAPRGASKARSSARAPSPSNSNVPRAAATGDRSFGGSKRAEPGGAEKEADEEGENSDKEGGDLARTTLHRDQGDKEEARDDPTPPKKRKLDSSTPAVPLVPARKPRVSAADLALSRSISSTRPITSSASKQPTSIRERAKSSDKAPSRPRIHQTETDDVDDDTVLPKAEPVDSDPLFLDASAYHDDDFGIGGGEEAMMDWDEGDGLNEDGLFDAAPSQDCEAMLSSERDERLENVSSTSRNRAPEAGTPTLYYTCQWRKQSTKKNPTWEGDGILRLDKNRKVTVRDADSRKEIASTVLPRSVALEEDKVVRMGNKDVEIGVPSNRQAYLGEDDELSSKPLASSNSRYPPNPPSSARDVKPIVARSSPAMLSSSTTPSLSKGFVIPGAAPRPAGIKPVNFFGGKNSSTSSRTASSGPQPLYNPTADGAIVMKRPTKEHEAEYNRKGYPVVDVVIDPRLGKVLRPHQQEGVRFMYECTIGMSSAGLGCILADEMGLGKTIQSITLIWTLLKQNPYYHGGFTRAGVIDRAMIVCPVTLMKNWSLEFKKWLGRDTLRVMVAEKPNDVKTFANSKTYQVLIVGYDRLTGAIEDVKYAQPPIGLIICDEGHKLKSSGTKTAKALGSLSCLRRVILSGTPIQNNLGEFFAMMDFVNPGLLQDYAYFKKNFEQPILKARKAGASKMDKRSGKEASESLAAIQRDFFLRRTADILDKMLPPKLEYTVFVVPTRREIEIYQQLLASSAVRSLLSGSGKSQQLSLLILLRKCATTPGLLMQSAKLDLEKKGDDSVFESDLTNLFPENVSSHDFALSAKLLALGAMLKKLHVDTDEKIVVVSNFTQTLDLVEKHCKKQRYPYCRLDGKTAQADRIPMVSAFNRGRRKEQFIFLLSSKSGGTGLNIVGASRLVLLDSDWNPSTDLQAMARIHRDGQTRTCVIYRFLTSGTIDEKIYQRQITKIALSGSVMEEDSSTSSSTKLDAFTADDLKNIFTLHTDTACDTHDLLGCACHGGEDHESFASQGRDDDRSAEDEDEDDDEEEDDDAAVFVPASQLPGTVVDKRALKKTQKNLSILKQWKHFDCEDYEKAKTEIQDPFLVALIWQLFRDVELTERVVKPIEDMSEREQAQCRDGSRFEVRGGQIGWVFEKRNDDKGRKKGDEVVFGEDADDDDGN